MYPRTPAFLRAEAAWITPPDERPVACAWCAEAAGEHPATHEHVAVVRRGTLRVDDLLCDGCADALDADVAREEEAALDAAMGDAPEADRDDAMGTLCEECGRHMADPRGPVCDGCAASWFTPGVYVPRADHEGPRPTVFDCGAAVSA